MSALDQHPIYKPLQNTTDSCERPPRAIEKTCDITAQHQLAKRSIFIHYAQIVPPLAKSRWDGVRRHCVVGECSIEKRPIFEHILHQIIHAQYKYLLRLVCVCAFFVRR